MKVYVAPFVRLHSANIKTLTLDDFDNVIVEKATFTNTG